MIEAIFNFLIHGLQCAFWCAILHLCWHRMERPKITVTMSAPPDYEAIEPMECGQAGHPFTCNCPQDARSAMFRKGRMPL